MILSVLLVVRIVGIIKGILGRIIQKNEYSSEAV